MKIELINEFIGCLDRWMHEFKQGNPEKASVMFDFADFIRPKITQFWDEHTHGPSS